MKAEQTKTINPNRTPPELADLRILIVEDKAIVAIEIERMVTELKCRIVGGGPVPRLHKALAILREHGRGSQDVEGRNGGNGKDGRAGEIDGVLLDVNLNGEEAYPIVEELTAQAVPFILMTGYGSTSIPQHYRRCPRLTKPFGYQDLIDMMVKVFLPQAPPRGAVKTV